MGRAGIRRRKPRRRLPPAQVHDDGTPPVMWSPPGSGFEASAYSPAGRMQQQWAFLRGASSSRSRAVRVGFRVVAVLFLTALLAGFVLQLLL